MPALVPVEDDPFQIQAKALPPVEGATPSQHYNQFVGVDYDPFVSPAEDSGRAFVSHLGPGVAGLLGAPGDFLSMVHEAGTWAGHKLSDAMGTPYAEPKGDAEKKARTILPGVTLPTSQQLKAQQDEWFGAPYQPQTRPGRYSAAISEMVPASVLGPEGWIAKGGLALGAGAGGEFGAEATKGTPLEPYGRFAGSVLGGIPAAAGSAMRSSPQRVVGQTMNGVGDQDIAAAADLMRRAAERGIQLTPAEAMQQVTGGGTGLGAMQRVIESTKRGSETMAPVMAERPGQVRDAGMAFADRLAPPNPQPSTIGPEAQRMAQSGLDLTRGVINQAAEPHYQALRGQMIPDADYAALAQNPSYQAALAEVRGNAELNNAIANLPDNDLSVVNEVVKQLDTAATAARQTVQNPAGNNYVASLRGGARAMADQIAGNVSPDWRAARDLVREGRAQYLEPLEAGPAGQIARADSVPTQTGALYPASPLEGAANETPQALTVMRAAEAEAANRAGAPMAMPGVGADLTRQHWVNTLNKTMADLQSGPNQWAGARFAKGIAGNNEQAATLRAGIETVAGQDAAQELDTLLEALRATGKRQHVGSQTAFNEKYMEDIGAAIPDTGGLNLSRPSTYIPGIKNAIRSAQQRNNVDALARLLLAGPDEAEVFLRGASRYAPNRPSAYARWLQANP